jgi:iron-regulated transporter 1
VWHGLARRGVTWQSCKADRNKEVGLLIAGVITSRVGLWMFDLAVTQMLQEDVDNDVIGIVNGVQQSMQNLFDVLGYTLSLIISKPAEFK